MKRNRKSGTEKQEMDFFAELPLDIYNYCLFPFLTLPEQIVLELEMRKPMRNLTDREKMDAILDMLQDYWDEQEFLEYEKDFEDDFTIYDGFDPESDWEDDFSVWE